MQALEQVVTQYAVFGDVSFQAAGETSQVVYAFSDKNSVTEKILINVGHRV